jgi:Invasion associated locus B (IalB) protein
MRQTVRAAILATALACGPACAENATLLQTFKDWSVYSASCGPKVCFAVAQPKAQNPKKIKRGPVYFYISQWPGDGVANEISVKMGYPFKPGATATLSIGAQKFDLFTKDEGAFVEQPEAEKNLVETLKKGGTMKIEGKSARGTATSDVYSLEGVASALDRAAKECSS